MRILTTSELCSRWEDVEAAVDATDGIDHWCSGPDWAWSVASGFGSAAEPIVAVSDHGYVLAARYVSAGGAVIIGGLEPLWGFAFPLLGPDTAALAREWVAHLASLPGWHFALVWGAPPPDHPTTEATAARLALLGPLRFDQGISRRVADLGAGFDHWWSGRSPRFRRNLSRAQRAFDADPTITIDDASDDPTLFRRILAIEAESWKGQDDSGVTSPEMSTTYRTLTELLARRGRLEAHIARRRTPNGDKIDVGYILGGIRNRTYRGLQLSYVEAERSTSLGHLLQLHQIRTLCRNGCVDRYDMGMDMEYKGRWAEQVEPTTTMVVRRAGRP